MKCPTFKVQVALDVSTGYLLNTQGGEGSVHDFTLFKPTLMTWCCHPHFVMDKGYEGIHTLSFKALLPIKLRFNLIVGLYNREMIKK